MRIAFSVWAGGYNGYVTPRVPCMSSETISDRPRRGEPAWEVASLFPVQGEWTEEEFLALDEASGNRLIELVDGFIEFLPMPDPFHQRVVRYLFRKVDAAADELGEGEAFFAPLPVSVGPRHLREPDIAYVKSGRILNARRPPKGADLVIEVVSRGKKSRNRDLVDKPVAYARARIPEYWIVDPQEQTITVLILSGRAYKTHGVFRPGEKAASTVLPGYWVDVAEALAAGRRK